MNCDNCGGKRRPTRKVETTELSVDWCDRCIEDSDAVELKPMEEDGKLMAVNTSEVKGYGDYKVDKIETEEDLSNDQELLRDVKVIDEKRLEGEI